MSKTKGRLYIAYGSNLNLEQMALRCPTAKLIGTAKLKDYRLLFRGGKNTSVATVEPLKYSFVPVLIWKLMPLDEAALDRYEGWPRLYRKEILPIRLKGKNVRAMIYIMDESYPCGKPDLSYLSTIAKGYRSAGFDLVILEQAVLDSEDMAKKGTL